MAFSDERDPRQMNAAEKQHEIATGIAYQGTVMPNIGITRDATGRTIYPHMTGVLNPALLGDPLKMSSDELQSLCTGHKVDIYTRPLSLAGNPMAYLKVIHEAPAKLLCAFSTTVRPLLHGIVVGRTGALYLEGISPNAIAAMLAYLIAVPNSDSTEMPLIYTRRLTDMNDWLLLWKMAQDLEMCLVLEQLKRQVRDDLKFETVAICLDLRMRIFQQNIPSIGYAIDGRLWALAKGQVPGFQLTASDVQALANQLPSENIDKVALRTFIHANYETSNHADESKLDGMSAELKSTVLDRWAAMHVEDAKRQQAIVDHKKAQEKLRDDSLLIWDSKAGKVKVRYLKN